MRYWQLSAPRSFVLLTRNHSQFRFAGERIVRRGPPTLTVALSTLTVALVLASIGAIVAVVSISNRHGREDIEERYGRTSTFAVGQALSRYLAPAGPMLAEARQRAERGQLAVDDPTALADYFIDKVRYQPGVAFFMYGDQATGRFVGAWRRDDGAIVIARSAAGCRRWTEERVGGWRRRPAGPVPADVPAGFDPRSRPWYHRAVERGELAWTEPYPFASGGVGITAALALPDASGERTRGVFAIDFPLNQASASLTSLLQGRWRVRRAGDGGRHTVR